MIEILHCARRSRWINSWSLVSAILIVQLTVVLGHTILEEYSCGQDDIEYGVTLRDGINAGIFRDRGPVKNMQECMHLCCTSSNCDVAMMHGPKCFSVRCLNDSACDSIPADDDDIDMQIAHMTTKGTGQYFKAPLNDTADQYDPDYKCPHNEIMYNVKLKAGLKAGKFTDIGKVKSINTCIRYCCESTQPCDLAFMLSDRCYLVKCYSEERCQALPAPSVDYSFHQKMAFVAPWLYQKGKKVVKIPSGQSPHHLQCIQSKRYTNSRLLDGQNAGDFTDVGRVTKPHICTRLCCEEPSCDLAYMFGRTCFLVRCRSERSCRVIPDDEARFNDKPAFVRSIQYIIKRKFGVKLRDDGTPVMMTKTGLEESCQLDGEIRNKTVLMAGMLSGQLTHHKGVSDITSCIKRCCAQDKCHVAMMMAGKCYSVFCTDKQYCQPKPAPQETHHTNPTVAYVKRGEITLAPKPEPIMPLIERFHPNIEQAVEEMYLEEDEKGSDSENDSGVDKNINASLDNKTANEQTEGSVVDKDRNELKGSGMNEQGDKASADYDEVKQSEDKASGESGQDDSGESEESGNDIDDSGEDEVEQRSMSKEHQGTS